MARDSMEPREVKDQARSPTNDMAREFNLQAEPGPQMDKSRLKFEQRAAQHDRMTPEQAIQQEREVAFQEKLAQLKAQELEREQLRRKFNTLGGPGG